MASLRVNPFCHHPKIFQSARHTYEAETKYEVSDMKKEDQLLQRKKQLKNRFIDERNDDILDGEK